MIDTTEDIEEVFLNPGDFHFGARHTRISTLLGSCVSITLWHPRRHIGGMCHYMLTTRPRGTGKTLDGRYADEAFALFLREVEAAGTHPGEYEAKLFGGGNMFTSSDGSKLDIGRRNVDFGRQFLQSKGIALKAEHVGGDGRRKLHFNVWNGDVWLAFREGSGAEIRKTGNG